MRDVTGRLRFIHDALRILSPFVSSVGSARPKGRRRAAVLYGYRCSPETVFLSRYKRPSSPQYVHAERQWIPGLAATWRHLSFLIANHPRCQSHRDCTLYKVLLFRCYLPSVTLVKLGRRDIVRSIYLLPRRRLVESRRRAESSLQRRTDTRGSLKITL